MKVLAFHLPQFHSIPENNAWWGEGFTEWTNTRRAEALFSGHRQPRTPINNNYYDLLDPATHAWQAELARQHGVYGFCYYHYWFGGKKLLEKPTEVIRDSGEPNFPFCFAWANEPWTRSWDGLESKILMPQVYGDAPEWRQHYEYLRSFFVDPRYIKIDQMPVFLIYRARSIPNINAMLTAMDTWAKADGMAGIHFVQMLTSFDGTPIGAPFAKCVYFEPMYTMSNNLPLFFRAIKGLRVWLRDRFLQAGIPSSLLHNRVPYDLVWHQILAKSIDADIYPGAFVDWDNTARKARKAMTCTGVSPKVFGQHFAAQYKRHKQSGQEFIFLNAWNEWAEGAYLEPDDIFRLDYLKSLRKAISGDAQT